MKKSWSRIFVFASALLAGSWVFSQGAIVNEFSNGPSGNQEFVELVAIGPPANPNCGPVDLRGWLLDDNNGDFSCGPCAGVGIAAGHLRFSPTVGPWAAIPTGSIIVIYDAATKNPMVPADDPDDNSPADGVYILPNNHAYIDVSVGSGCAGGNVPTGSNACGTCAGISAYAGACYTPAIANTNCGLRNSGDAMQVRMPSGAYYHGIGYGTPSSLITGGPDGLMISGDGTGKYYTFTNAVSDDYRNVNNYTSGAVSLGGETPGVANTALNATWIASLTTPCLLPVIYAKPLEGKAMNGYNELAWKTAYEYESDHFSLYRSSSPETGFEEIARLSSKGNSGGSFAYQFQDRSMSSEISYYKLLQVDRLGSTNESEVVELRNANWQDSQLLLFPNPSAGYVELKLPEFEVDYLSITDELGRTVRNLDTQQASQRISLQDLPDGIYFVRGRGEGRQFCQKLVLSKH
jgi:hypothetical protein